MKEAGRSGSSAGDLVATAMIKGAKDAHYPAKDVTSWLGNSPDIANKHYAMTMQASFDRAAAEGASIPGLTENVRQKVRQTSSAKGCQHVPACVTDGESLVNGLADLLNSYPART